MVKPAHAMIVAAIVAAGATAHAGALVVGTLEFGSWPAAVAALEADTSSAGRAVNVFVRDEHGVPVHCGDYSLTLDEIGSRAFRVGRCDDVSSATEVFLEHRSALFARDDIVPRALPAGISAVELRTGGASGGAGSVGGSELSCSVTVRPYLTNMETGAHVYLSPGRFVVRARTSAVTVAAAGRAWTLRAAAQATLVVDYEVFDSLRSRVVLHDHATLACESGVHNATERAASHTAVSTGGSCSDAPDLAIGARADGSTRGGSISPLYRIAIRDPALFRVMLDSEFGGEVDLYAGCPHGRRSIVYSTVFGGGPEQSLSWSVEPGTYYLAIVDADIHRHTGEYSFTATTSIDLRFFDPSDASAFAATRATPSDRLGTLGWRAH